MCEQRERGRDLACLGVARGNQDKRELSRQRGGARQEACTKLLHWRSVGGRVDCLADQSRASPVQLCSKPVEDLAGCSAHAHITVTV
jgi:hypothetical protein